MKPIQTSKKALRRLLLEKQRLLRPRVEPVRSPQELRRKVMGVIRELECIQIDPVSAVRPNQHLVLAARVDGYRPDALLELLRENEVFEYFANAACVIPMEDYPLFEPVRARMRSHTEASLDALRPVVEEVLHRLETEGPLPAKAFESEIKVHGYWDNVSAKTKATSHALNLLADAARIRIVGREGNQRLFALASRSVPYDLLLSAEQMDMEESANALLRKYFRAYGVFEPSDPRLGWQRLNAAQRKEAINRYVNGGELAEVEADGVKHPYYMLAADVERLYAHMDEAEKERAADDAALPITFLPPLDNLLWSRKRLEELFDFEYRWEIYTPAVKRRYGYYAMPILAGDRLIGRMDPRLDSKNKHLSVQLLQIEPGVARSSALETNIREALQSFAFMHGAETVSVEQYRWE